MKNVLDKIIQDKKESLKILKKDNTLDALEAKIKNFKVTHFMSEAFIIRNWSKPA